MRSNNKGFTLIEIMCTVALLSIVITASSSFLLSITRSQHSSREQLYANNIAQEVIEEVIRTGDVTKDYSANYDGYTIEINATSAPIGSGTGGDGGYGDDSDDEDAPETTKIPITYDTTGKIPDEGERETPAPDPQEPFHGMPADYNVEVQLFDYIDEDLPMLITAAQVLLDQSNTKFSEQDVYDILTSSSEFAPYIGAYSAGDAGASNLKKAVMCYKNMSASGSYSVAALYDEFVDRHNEVLTFITNSGFAAPSSCTDFLWNYESGWPDATISSEDLGERWYNYVMGSENPAHVITELYETFLEMLPYYETEDTILTDTGCAFIDGIPLKMLYSGNSRIMNKIENDIYYRLNTATFNATGTTTGPMLISKFYKKGSDVCIAYDNAWGTKLVDEASTVRFQLYGRYVNYYTSGTAATTWGWSASDSTGADEMGIKVVNLPSSITHYDWATGDPVYGYQNNIINQFVFVVTGGLSYRTMTFTADFYPDGSCKTYINPEDGQTYDYHPSVLYFEAVEYGEEKYNFNIVDDSNWVNLQKNPNYNPGDVDIPEIEGGTGGDGNGGTSTYNVAREPVTTYLNMNITGMDFYTVTVKNSQGKIMAQLTSYGSPAYVPEEGEEV